MKYGISLNGGGFRGLYTAIVLDSIEQILGANIASKFNYVGGTSTGGILSCGITTNENGKYKYTAEQIVDFYITKKDIIFPKNSFFERLSNGFGLLDQKYPSEGIYGVLSELLGEATLSSIKNNHLIVTSANTETLKPVIFKSSKANESVENDFKLKDVAFATGAAPTYFEPHFVKKDNVEYSFVDGGVYAGNPVMCVFTEMLKDLQGNEKMEDIFILNVGTGYSRKPIKYYEAKNFGMLEWIRKNGGSPLFDLMFETTNAANIHFVENLIGGNLFVLDCELIDPKIQTMDNVSQKQIDYLKKMADKTIKENRPFLENLPNILK